jgi:hypothetical protein
MTAALIPETRQFVMNATAIAAGLIPTDISATI